MDGTQHGGQWGTKTSGATRRELAAALEQAVAAAWQTGWQPVDLGRSVGRSLGARQVRVLSDAIAADLHGYPVATLDPRWPGQLAEFDARVWWPPDRSWLEARCELPGADPEVVVRHALEVLTLVAHLPAIERLGPLPGEAGPAGGGPRSGGSPDGHRPVADERRLSRIRALLAKAEATTYPAEAEAFTAAAQERMARYSIDAAMLAASDPAAGRGAAGRVRPGARRIGIDQPYEAPKAVLLGEVAGANRCRSVWSSRLGFSTVVGFDPDLDAVETLFTSLLVQATAAMNRAGASAGAGARNRTRPFRQSFLAAYATRIGERLAEITQRQTAAAAAEPGHDRLLPVLASREEEVDDEVARMFPVLNRHSASGVTDPEGYRSGRGAAELATLTAGPELADPPALA